MKRSLLLLLTILLVAFPLSVNLQAASEDSYDDDDQAMEDAMEEDDSSQKAEKDVNPDEMIEREDSGGLVEDKKEEVTSQELKDPYLREYKDNQFVRIIERGFYLHGAVGAGVFVGPHSEYTKAGLVLDAGVGYDVVEKWLQVELFFRGISAPSVTDSDSDGYPDNRDALVDGSHLSLLGIASVNVTYMVDYRWLLKLRVGGGVFYDDHFIDGYDVPNGTLEIDPSTAKDVPDLGGAINGGLAFEYYTAQRHLSTGLLVDFTYLLGPGAMVVSIMPTIKYTF